MNQNFMMPHQRLGPRAEYHSQECLRIQNSDSLEKAYRKLKALKLNLTFYNPEGVSRLGEIKYKFNLDTAKSIFRFNCPNDECVRGDFDLTDELAKAVAARRKTVTGEMCCQGWRNKTTIDTEHCHNIARYELTLGY